MSMWECPKCGGVPGVTVCCSDAQTAQAGHVPEASCGECGKKASDGWALYCVACMEEAGLPAQAVPLLSEAEIKAAALEAFNCTWDADNETLVNKYGYGVYLWRFIDFARAIEAAVRTKMGVAVPMTAAGQMFAEAKKAVGVTFRVNPNLDAETVRRAHVAVSEAPPYELPDWQKAALCVCREVVTAWGSEESRAAHGIVGKEGA